MDFVGELIKEALVMLILVAFWLARSSITWLMSTPIVFHIMPTLFAARKISNPAPLPRSMTVSPCLFRVF